MYSPLTEERDVVEVVELVPWVEAVTVIKFIEVLPTVPTQGHCTFSFSDQIEGLTLYQPDVEDMNGFDSFYSQSMPMIIR